MRKRFIYLIMMCLLFVLTAGCSNDTQTLGKEGDGLKNNDKEHIVATIFPEYDWVREIVKGNDNVELTLLLDKGIDMHSFQPTADDIIKLSTCDVFIYVGGESDKWVETALSEAANKDMIVINLLDVLGNKVKEEELVEGMQGEETEEEGEEPEYDEHVWLSLSNAETIVEYITGQLVNKDPEYKDLYEANAKEYIAKLSDLDIKYHEAVDSASVKTLLFGDRFPFRYLTDDYGLDYYAAFVGCSAESEASFATITFLAEKADELDVPAIIKLESSDGEIAKTIIETASKHNRQIVTMNSMQSITAKDIEAGQSYIGIMESNLDVLREALK